MHPSGRLCWCPDYLQRRLQTRLQVFQRVVDGGLGARAVGLRREGVAHLPLLLLVVVQLLRVQVRMRVRVRV